MSWFLYRTTLVPLGASPYLCTSTEIEVTPLTVKSKGGIGYLRRKGEKIITNQKKHSREMGMEQKQLYSELMLPIIHFTPVQKQNTNIFN